MALLAAVRCVAQHERRAPATAPLQLLVVSFREEGTCGVFRLSESSESLLSLRRRDPCNCVKGLTGQPCVGTIRGTKA